MPRLARHHALLTALTDSGGYARYADLVRVCSEGTVRSALRDGLIVRVGRGMYALTELGGNDVVDTPARSWARWTDGPTDAELLARVARYVRAQAVHGALSHRSAAAHYDWPILVEPTAVEVRVPTGRKSRSSKEGLRIRHGALTPDELREHVTSPVRTVLDCARELPFAEALAVADSALRAGDVGPSELYEVGATYRGPGARQARQVAFFADARADNPFESALRAAVWGVPGVTVEPQVEIRDQGFYARVDLADRYHRIVLEADSYEFHGSAERFAQDRRRYAELTARGWVVLPFGFATVVRDPHEVRTLVEGATIRGVDR